MLFLFRETEYYQMFLTVAALHDPAYVVLRPACTAKVWHVHVRGHALGGFD